LEEEPEIAERK